MKRFYQIVTTIILAMAVLLPASAQTQNGSISGTVKTSDGSPAAFVSVAIKDTRKGAQTAENGTFSIRGLKEGEYVLRVSFTGLQSQEKNITVAAGKVSQADFVLAENSNRLSEVQLTANRSVNEKAVNVGKGGIPAIDMPQAVQVLDSTLITDQQANRLADVIKNVNGVAFGENRGSVNDSFFARGYSLGGNNVLKNGARSSIGGSPEASTLESVEVLKGSAALLYGGVTGGAVINLVTKKPKFNYGGEVTLRNGSYGMYKPTVDVYGPLSKSIAFRAIATREKANSFRDDVNSERFYVNPSLLFKLGGKTDLIVQGDYLKSFYTPDFGIGTVNNQIVPIGRNAFLNTVWAYNHTNTATTQANLTHQINTNWKLNVVGAFQAYNRDYFGAERPAANAAGVAARNLTRSRSREFTYNQQVTLTGSLNTGAIKHTLLAGGDADESRTTSFSFKYDNNTTAYNYGNINLLDPSSYNTRTDMPGTRVIGNTFTPTYRMGAFVQDLVELNEKFKVLAGLRYTFQKTPRTITYNSETTLTTLSNNSIGKSKIENVFSPKVGLIYQPIRTSSVYASYANNFTSNSGTDVNLVPLAASIIDQYEVGLKNDLLQGAMSFNVTWYKIINRNFAQTAVNKADGTPNTDATIKEFSGRTASEGLEVDVNGKLSKGVNFIAGYAYSYFRYKKTAATGIREGERIIGTTPHTANATVFYTVGSGAVKGLKLGASGFYTGRRNMGFNQLKAPAVARGPAFLLSSFTTFDLSAGYTYRKFSVLGKLSNISNEINYYVHENYSVNPIPPRMFSTTLGYKF